MMYDAVKKETECITSHENIKLIYEYLKIFRPNYIAFFEGEEAENVYFIKDITLSNNIIHIKFKDNKTDETKSIKIGSGNSIYIKWPDYNIIIAGHIILFK